jgi:hypothetical protein
MYSISIGLKTSIAGSACNAQLSRLVGGEQFGGALKKFAGEGSQLNVGRSVVGC